MTLLFQIMVALMVPTLQLELLGGTACMCLWTSGHRQGSHSWDLVPSTMGACRRLSRVRNEQRSVTGMSVLLTSSSSANAWHR
ncbi:hypothetical protein LZ30DRAFT_312332 [Colletotrichum cereale]|nr:hypothetical protein LZ30DRAFT_312332 [Colletotrichum cereale]